MGYMRQAAQFVRMLSVQKRNLLKLHILTIWCEFDQGGAAGCSGRVVGDSGWVMDRFFQENPFAKMME